MCNAVVDRPVQLTELGDKGALVFPSLGASTGFNFHAALCVGRCIMSTTVHYILQDFDWQHVAVAELFCHEKVVITYKRLKKIKTVTL